MRRTIFNAVLFLLFGSLLFSGCHPLQRRAVWPPELLAEFSVPSDANHILLPIRFQGREYRFILDTGCTDIIFDISLRDKLGKRILWPKKGDAARGKSITVEYFGAPQAYLGPLSLKGGRLIGVVNLEQLISAEKNRIHGIIGMDFLKKHVVQIDFDRKKVSFLKGRKDTDIFSFLRPQENEHPEWGEQISIRKKLFTDLWYAKGKIQDDTSINFLIDTGWGGPSSLESKLFDKVCSKIVSGTKWGNITTTTTGGFSGSRKATVIERFSVGPHEYKDIAFLKGHRSILGRPFLSRHLVTFDFPNGRMYLKRGREFDKSTISFLSLEGLDFQLCRKRNDICVSVVDPNGPAYRKGIRQGDILLNIDSQDVSSYGLVELVEFLSQAREKQDGVLKFTLKRGDDIMHISFVKSDVGPERDAVD